MCPHCKKQFPAKTMEIELTKGLEEGDMRLGKVAYSCPNCHVFPGTREAASGVGIEDVFKLGIENFMKRG